MNEAPEFTEPADTVSVRGGSIDFRHAGRRAAALGSMWLMLAAAVFMGGLLMAVSPAEAVGPPPGSQFAITSFLTEVKDSAGVDETRAGAHPVSARAEFKFSTYDTGVGTVGQPRRIRPAEDPKTIITKLPPGFSGNPTTVDTCPLILVPRGPLSPMLCPDDTVVGYVYLDGAFSLSAPIINVPAEDGYPAEFAFSEAGFTYPIYPELRSDGDYGINMVVPAANNDAITRIDATFCSYGVEANMAQHAGDSTFRCLQAGEPGAYAEPFLTNPATECTDQAPFTDLLIDSWQSPGVFKSARAVSPLITDCESLEFDPAATIVPTTAAPDAPTGLDVDLSFPQEDNAQGQAPPALKKAVVTLPEGMSISPAAANGLRACSDEQLRLKSKAPVMCPGASKIGTVTAKSPLMEETVSGGVFIRSQNSNDPESGEMFRLALVLENEKRGISIRLPGQVRVNETTGRIETTFDNNPELPVSSIQLDLKDGPRAPLSMPSTCGVKTVDIEFSSWGGQVVNRTSEFNVDCTPGLGGFAPGFAAGTTSPAAGASSPFALRVTRQDGERELKSIKQIKLPEGLLGDVSSVPLCGEAQAAMGACPEASRVGHVQVAAGAGALPLWVPQAGKEATAVYLTGPYNGAPYGLSIKVPAQAGPFDLGRVVVRSALHVDERTAAITSGVDETRLIDPNGTVTKVLPGDLPRILKGVLLDQREIRVRIDRPGFMINPTDCSQQHITAEIHAYGGGKADVNSRFRAADCAELGFKPRFRARILNRGRRSTLRSFHPRTRFTVVPRKGDANIGGARVALPSSTILDQSNIGTTCTRAQMAERDCPAKSVVGYARAWSPLLRRAVEGPVYLAANGGARPLPDLAAVLDGEIRVVLQGEISTLRSGRKARLQNTFRVVPDAPVSRFVLTMRGGKNKGLLVNSTDLCRSKERGVAVFRGQNGRRHRLRPRIATRFKGCAKARRQVARRKATRKKAARRSAAPKAAARQVARRARTPGRAAR